MLHLFDAQQITYQHLHHQMQVNNTIQQTKVDTLRELTVSIYQRNFDHIFASIPIFDGSKKEDLFEWLERLETVCLQNGHNI